MKLLKRVTVLTLTFSISFNPILYGDDSMSIARNQIEENNEALEIFVDNIVQEDFFKAIDVLNYEILKTTQAIDASNELAVKMQYLNEVFNQIAQMPPDQLASIESDFKEAYHLYEKSIKDQFDMSWAPTMAAHQYQTLSPALTLVLGEYRKTCEKGRSDLRFQDGNPVFQSIPRPSFSVYVGYRSEGDNSAVDFSYRQEDSTNKEIKEYNKTMSKASAVGGTAGTFYIAGAEATASSFGVSKAAATNYFMPAYAAAAWTAVAVVVVLAVVSSRKAAREKFRGIKKQHEAMEYLTKHMVTDSEIAKLYTEKCASNMVMLQSVVDLLVQLEANPDRKDQIVAPYLAKEDKSFKEQYSKAQAAGCRTELFNLYKAGKCAKVDICKVEKERVILVEGGFCQIPVSYSKKNFKNDTKTYSEIFKRDDLEQKTIDLALFNLADIFGRNYDQSLKSIKSATRIAGDSQKRRAFSNLQQALEIRRTQVTTN